MKKLFLFLFMIFAVQMVFGQYKVDDVASVTIQSDTSYAEVTYDSNYQGVVFSNGVAGYTFTIADTLSLITLEGGYLNSSGSVSYVVVSSSDSVTTGNYSLFDTDPDYFRYRLGMYGLSGDTVTVSNIIYFEKRPLVK